LVFEPWKALREDLVKSFFSLLVVFESLLLVPERKGWGGRFKIGKAWLSSVYQRE